MSVVTVDEMRDKLLSLETVRTSLEASEPVTSVPISIDESTSFRIEPHWAAGIETGTEVVPAWVSIGGQEFQLTAEGLLDITSIVGLTKAYVQKTPVSLLMPHLDYWFKFALADGMEHKLLTSAGIGSAVTRQSVVPFSNVQLLDIALDGIRSAYGDGEVLVDYKFNHDLKSTRMRLIVPSYRREILNTGTDLDEWSTGIQISNSLTGAHATELSGYLFRWWCTNGATSTAASSGAWRRKRGHGGSEVYEWARTAVDAILRDLEPSLDAVQHLADTPIRGEVTEVLTDVFNRYSLPASVRRNIISQMVEEDNLTMYAVMQAITQVANSEDLNPAQVDAIMRVGGDFAEHAHSRCDSCRRMLPLAA